MSQIDHNKIIKKTYRVFFIVNVFSSILALIVARFELSPVTIIQGGNMLISLFLIVYTSNIVESTVLRYMMFIYYTCGILLGMWFGLGIVHPIFLGYSIMLFQLILITSKNKFRLMIIAIYSVVIMSLGLYDILYRNFDLYPEQSLNIERLLSIASFLIGNLLILHFNRAEHDIAVEEISRLSYIDELTGSQNRHAFYKELQNFEDAFKRTKNDYLISYIDMDGLKNVNDQFGHVEGDFAIKEIAKHLKGQLRTYEYFFRVGGDEFIIASVCEEENLINRINIAQDLVERNSNKPYPITFSYGCCARSDCHSIKDMMSNADNEMYKMKKYNTKFN